MSVAKAIAALQAAFPGDQIALLGTEQYSTRNGSYLSKLESDIQPACIFQPKTKEEVSQFVKIMKPFAVNGETAFAIRAAGNMPTPGCANIQDGITLDLGLMTRIELENGVVSVAAGAQWAAVNEKVQAAGLGVTGGRSGTGGIGGLALAGGLSFFSSREGFISDNVLNFEVVLASGEVVNANTRENSDLWIALKGGANNFGVVTRFNLSTFEQGSFWGGNLYYFAPGFPSQIEAMVVELQKPDPDPNTHIMISIGFAAQFGQTMCMNTVYYTKDVQNPPVLEPFTTIQPQIAQLNSLKLMSLTEAASAQAADVSNQVRCAYMNITVKADVATLQAAADLYTAAIEPIKSSVGLICSLTLQPYPVSLLQQSITKGGNSLGLDPSAGPLVSVLLLTYWKEKSDDDRILAMMQGALEGIRAQATEKGTALDFIYLNYAFSFQDPISSYGAENKRKLQEVSKKYDPDSLFQKGVPGGFKLF